MSLLPLQRDWFYRLVQGVMELGSAPDPLEATIALTPVDFLAQSILCMSQCIAEQGNGTSMYAELAVIIIYESNRCLG